jgi:photosystem II stability/assembly factor-like uncharacterized protein
LCTFNISITMTMSRRLLVAMLLIISQLAVAQNRPDPIYVAPDAPNWVQMMDAPNPNVRQIQAAYDAWYAEHPFEKNNYTQYYKRWMRWAKNRTNGDGALEQPTLADQTARERQLLDLRRQAAPAAENSPSAWTFKAPVRTTDVDGTTFVTWQTNIYAVDIAPSDPNILYAGGETGGVWKTTNKGASWTHLTENLRHGSFSAVKIHPTNPNIVYAATDGRILKTQNGGNAWAAVLAPGILTIHAIAISTSDPEIVHAAGSQGLFRSTDGGLNWTTVHNNATWDVDYNPSDPNTVYCIRKNSNSSEFCVSTDGGVNWTTSPTGWWTPASGETVTGAHIAVCPSNASKVYAYLCGAGPNLFGYVGVFVSNDGGTTWANTHPLDAVGNSPIAYSVPTHTNLMTSNGTTGLEQGFYDMAIIVNPTNDQQLIAGGTSWYRSNNGGQTWTGIGGYQSGLAWSHPDIQALAVSGTDLWIATDGGLNYSNNWATSIEARMNGINGSDMWGFDAGWNDDILVGGRYHNGNMAWSETFGTDITYRMGGGEAPTGYVNPGPGMKTMFSDIGGKSLKGPLTAGVNNFAFTFEPNESYAYYANSELTWHPHSWNTVYAGKDNKIWRSEDGGSSFEAIYTFPGTAANEVFEIEICRTKPGYLYCSQWDGTDDKIWRSEDEGLTWTACTPLPLPNNNDRVKMAVSAEDPFVLWVALTYGSNGKKVYKSTDGGTTWVNLTTPMLDNIRVTNIMAQYGTDGGVYLGCDGAVFYRNNTHVDWQSYSIGLPLSAETNRLKPFYRENKIRNGCWGHGIWEAELFEPSAIMPQAMASTRVSRCIRDTVYFDDYSVTDHYGATWSWSFDPAPAFVSGQNTRTPKVVFGAPGIYKASMMLNQDGTPYTSLIQIEVLDQCAPDSIPDKAAIFGGNANPGSAIIPPLGITTNTFTLSAWIKPDGIQPEYAAIFMTDGGNASGLNFRETNNTIGYHWNGSNWWWDSGLTVPSGEWSHVALVVDGASVTKTVKVYVNGVPATNTVAVPAYAFSSSQQLGTYRNWDDRNYKGDMDEVAIYDRALTISEIRELMHLPHHPATEPNLIAYYQFNEATGAVLDRVGIRHAGLGGSAQRTVSSCPMGPGNSHRMTVNAGGAYNFGQTGLTLGFPATGPYPNGELVATRINWTPHNPPNTTDPISPSYWVVHNFGTNATFNELDSIRFDRVGSVHPVTLPAEYSFYKRQNRAHGNTWGTPADQAESLVYATQGSVTFSTDNNITNVHQFIVAKPAAALPVEWLVFDVEKAQLPATKQFEARLRWATGSERQTAWFVIERSTDGIRFTDIGRVAAAGNSDTRQDYKWTDPLTDLAVLPERVYYRIRQEDTNGRSANSVVRSILFTLKYSDSAAGVYPNPAAMGGLLRVWSDIEAPCTLRLFDTKGRAIRILNFESQGTLDLRDLAAGTYAWRIESDTRIWTGRVVLK